MHGQAERLRRHIITRQSSSSPPHHHLPPVNALVVDANDVVALTVADQLNVSTVFGIVHHDDFLLDHDKHNFHHHDHHHSRHATDETGESGILPPWSARHGDFGLVWLKMSASVASS